MTQCNQKMKVKAVMPIFGKSLTSGDLCTFFQHFLESFSQLEHAVDSALQLLSFSDILYFTGDGSGMSICNFSYCSLVGN